MSARCGVVYICGVHPRRSWCVLKATCHPLGRNFTFTSFEVSRQQVALGGASWLHWRPSQAAALVGVKRMDGTDITSLRSARARMQGLGREAEGGREEVAVHSPGPNAAQQGGRRLLQGLAKVGTPECHSIRRKPVWAGLGWAGTTWFSQPHAMRVDAGAA